MRYLSYAVAGLFVGLILLLIGLGIATQLDVSWVRGYRSLGWGLVFIGMVAAALAGMVALAIHAVAIGSLALVKRPFVLMVLAYLVLLPQPPLLQEVMGGDAFELTIHNATEVDIYQAHIFGRRDHVEVDTLRAGASLQTRHRGRRIAYVTRNSYANRIYVNWQTAQGWHEQQIIGRWRVIGREVTLRFEPPDASTVKLR